MQNKIKKLTYLNCEKDEHTTEPLSRICIEQDCKNKTLICSICEELYHKNHETLPLKTYLNKIYAQSNLQIENINPLYFTNQLDQIKNSFFNVISEHKREVMDLLNNIETQGKMFFNKVEQQVLSMMQISHPVDYMSQEKLNARRLKEYYLKMTKLINLRDKEKFSLEKKLSYAIDNCKEKEKKLAETLSKFRKELENGLLKISATLDENLILSIKSPTFIWSQTLKGHKIKINDTIADQTGMESSGQRFIMLQPSLTPYGMKKINWGIKVKKFVGWIGLGICLKNIIKNANYHFNYNNIGHGSYLVSSNGYSWSHSVKEFNSAAKTFHFTVNDIVYMEYDPIDKKLRFRKNKGNEKFELTIADPPANDEYHPCANICSNGDSVEIINPGIQLS